MSGLPRPEQPPKNWQEIQWPLKGEDPIRLPMEAYWQMVEECPDVDVATELMSAYEYLAREFDVEPTRRTLFNFLSGWMAKNQKWEQRSRQWFGGKP